MAERCQTETITIFMKSFVKMKTIGISQLSNTLGITVKNAVDSQP